MTDAQRGQVKSVAVRGAFTSKPRPCIVITNDAFARVASVTIVPLTSQDENAWLIRPRIDPTHENGLERISFAMVDKISTVAIDALGEATIGLIAPNDLIAVERALAIYLGFRGAA
jgi:mRNA interferase MazF